MPVSRLVPLVVASVLAARAALGASGDWPQFRGPGASGIGDPALPGTWSATENVAWKRDLPGRGWSSPVVVGGRVFVTTVVNTGQGEAPRKGLYFGGDRPEPPKSEHVWRVIALDLATGAVAWDREVRRGVPRTPVHLKGSHAAETPASDGTRVFAAFGGVGIFAFGLDGTPAWSRPLEPRKVRYGWGTASSPIVHAGRVYHVDDNDEDSALLVLDAATGREIRRVPRDEKSNWATPFAWDSGGRVEIVTPGTGAVRSYDPDGNPLWTLRGMSSIAIPTPVAGAGLLFVTSGYVGDAFRPLYAVRPGATGDISLPKGATNGPSVAWMDPVGGPYNPSPLLVGDRLHVLFDRGLVTCRDARTGRVLYDRERLKDGMAFTASPWASGGRVFCLNEDGACYVLAGGDRFEVIRVNRLADDDMCMATPALAGDRLLIRTSSRLYCIRERSP